MAWLLSRKGTMKPAAAFAENASGAAALAPVVVDPRGGNADAGKLVYQRICTPCHGETGKGGHAEGAVLPDNVEAEHVMTIATTGHKEMPSFAQVLSEEMKDVAAYVSKLLSR